MTIARVLRLAGLSFVAALSLAAVEGVLAPGGGGLSLTAPAFADDDDDDGGGRRGGGGGGGFGGLGDFGGGFAPRIMQRMFDGDDDDDDYRPAPRRRAAPERRAAPPRARPERRAAPPRARPVAREARRALPEIVAAGVTPEALGQIRAAGFTVLAERRLALLPDATVRLRGPRNLSAAGARARIASLAPAAIVDDNALYRPNAREQCAEGKCFPYRSEDWSVPVCAARGVIGMIDTRVETSHPALAGLAVEGLSTRGEKRPQSSADHGTEVAILLAGRRDGAADMRLVAVEAFHRTGGADRADAFDLVAAIDLLAARGAAVVNLSLSGPANALLDRAGAVAAERGMILVVAVGNDGPSAAPLYPAAYPWAVAVTAVDARGEVYARAGRGSHVAFAAPGVRLEMPDRSMKPGRQRSGTSYAAPLVAAALSAHRANGGSDRPTAQVIASLAGTVEDRGAPGRDPVFGYGALDAPSSCPTPSRAEAL